MNIVELLTQEFKLRKNQVESTIKLIDEGNTIPFIARYRKEQTGEMDDVTLRELDEKLTYLRNLESRQEEVIRLIEEQGQMTPELKNKILKSKTVTKIDDLYRPFRPKRRTRAIIAKEKGLDPLAEIMLKSEMTIKTIEEIVSPYIDEEKDVNSLDDALAGAMDIIAETISDEPSYREIIRTRLYNTSTIMTQAVDKKEKSVYEMYYDYSEKVSTLPNHRVLAINRAEKEKFIKVKMGSLEDIIVTILKREVMKSEETVTTNYLKQAIEDSYKRLIFPSIEREIRNSLTERAEEDAIKVFGKNLKPLLMQPPISGKVVMGYDPGFRTGCKIAVVDETGKFLDSTTVFPTEPQNKVEETKRELVALIEKYDIDMIAIGNGTASRESETIIADMISEIDRNVYYTIVSEAGASVYSASKVANDEYPDINVSIRGAISIAKRLQDPLAELVKIDPKHVGVGQYQHDLNQKKLDETLKGVVEDCVNAVGIDLNTASVSLLSYVAGVSSTVAKNIVAYREELGKFESRKDLLKVKRLGQATFVQCAGFLRIPGGKNPLDNTSVHPESYSVADKLLKRLDYSLEDIRSGAVGSINNKFEEQTNLEEVAEELEVGIPTLEDIITEIKKPGRDPRESLDAPILRSDILKIEDLKEGIILTGTVRNVVDFGAFVDIGLKGDGLVHISHLADKYVKNPMDVVSVGDIVKVKILSIDIPKNRVGLSMKEL